MIEMAAAMQTLMPVTVKIDLSALNYYLLTIDNSVCSLCSGFGINAGKGRTGDIHCTGSLIVAHVFKIAEPDYLILLKVQEDRERLLRFSLAPIGLEPRNDGQIAYSP